MEGSFKFGGLTLNWGWEWVRLDPRCCLQRVRMVVARLPGVRPGGAHQHRPITGVGRRGGAGRSRPLLGDGDGRCKGQRGRGRGRRGASVRTVQGPRCMSQERVPPERQGDAGAGGWGWWLRATTAHTTRTSAKKCVPGRVEMLAGGKKRQRKKMWTHLPGQPPSQRVGGGKQAPGSTCTARRGAAQEGTAAGDGAGEGPGTGGWETSER